MRVPSPQPSHPADHPDAVPRGAAALPRTLDARELLAGAGEVLIRLDDALYRLRLTRNRRLILTK